jgi:hypothetical protein
MMKQKKRVWMSFNLWEANVFEQYLEEMAAQGWFLESVGGSVMKFHRAEPAKRRYAALLVPGSSSLTGADSWKAEQFRKQCQEAGWNFECSGTFWQIFYTTDDAVERTGDMTEEKQFLIQKSLSWTWSVKLCYPVLIVLEAWAVYRYLQNPGKLFSDSMLLLLNLLMVGIFVSWIVSYVRIFWWVYKTTSAFKKGEPLPKMDLRRKVNFKKRIILFDGILILGGLAFSSSMSAFVGFMISSVLIVAISFFMRNWIRNNGSGDNRDDWIGYLVGVAVVCMITIPLCNAATSHFLGEEEPDADKKQTIFASCQNDEFKINGSGTPVGVTIYKSPIPLIIRKTSECYPKDMSDLWDQTEQKLPAEMESLSNGMEVAWYRYMFRKDETNPDPESNASVNKEEPALDEVILKDKSHLIILDFGGGTDLAGLKEAVAAFEEDDKPYMGAPKIVLDGHNYFATELCIVNEVPERYLYAGELTDQEKKYAFIDGSKYYTPNSDGVPEDFYIYQECGTPVSEHEVDNTKRQWAYVKWRLED